MTAQSAKITISHESPPECGACLAKVYIADLDSRLTHGNCFSPDLRTIANGILIEQRRMGLNEPPFGILKFRTMKTASYPIQIYPNRVAVKNPRTEQVTGFSKFMRRCFLDELPQLVNLMKGDMKLVGVRPLTIVETRLLPPDIRELRSKTKPGLVGVLYGHPPTSNRSEQFKIEENYIKDHLEQPFVTELKYLFKVAYQFLLKGRRSS